jgi:hypothetical protein
MDARCSVPCADCSKVGAFRRACQASCGTTPPVAWHVLPYFTKAKRHPLSNNSHCISFLLSLSSFPFPTFCLSSQAFTGGPPPVPREPGGTAPSRVLLQQLYDAGMVDALPEDVQVRVDGAPLLSHTHDGMTPLLPQPV